MSQPATPRSCFTHIGVSFAQVLFLCGDSKLVQKEFRNAVQYAYVLLLFCFFHLYEYKYFCAFKITLFL